MLMDTQRKMTKEQVRQWVEGEVQSHMDGYGNTRAQALEMMADLLGEGEYREELSDDNVAAAMTVVRSLRQQS
jgi:hypothetical protein